MLVLTRRPGESIMIGNDVTVTVLEVRNEQVRIGVAAPRAIQVHREEVYLQIADANTAAVRDAASTAAALRSRAQRLPNR